MWGNNELHKQLIKVIQEQLLKHYIMKRVLLMSFTGFVEFVRDFSFGSVFLLFEM